jgi:PhoPQ-activated pathogenicity-related protein
VAELRDVPNQKLVFPNDPFGPREEDEIIAYTWRKYLDTGDENWPLRLPMTKAAVRAMDTVTAFAASADGGGLKVDRFLVSGASKRGWTTWTTAAVDPRVVAIAPMVIDVLNVVPSFRHHYGSYGFWALAVKDYYDAHLMDALASDSYAKLMEIEDPYSYIDRFTMPKLIIAASGDQFFLPDSTRFYFDKLPGESHLLYESNAEHSLKGTDVVESLTAFYQSVIDGAKRPKMEWKLLPSGTLRVETSEAPLTIKVWRAHNAAHRDFRIDSIGKAYKQKPLKAVAPGAYEVRLRKPSKGWAAYFVEATFRGAGAYPLKFTTQVYVTPDVEPFTLPASGPTKLEAMPEQAPAKSKGKR